jgi:ferredoxin
MFRASLRFPSRKRAKPQNFIAVNRDRCHYCGACVAVCPPDALFLVDTWLEIKETCTNCERCVTVCPVRALSVVERKAS